MSTIEEAYRTYLELSLNPASDTPFMSAEEISYALNGTPSAELIYEWFQKPPYKTQLLKAGLPLPPLRKTKASLSAQQLEWIRVASNPYTQKSLQLLAKEHGITIEQHMQWLLQPHFRREYEKRIAGQTLGVKGEVVRKTMTKAISGDQKATENYFRMINEPLPQLQLVESNQGSLPVSTIMEVLQRILTPSQLAEVSLAFMGQSPAELSSPVEDETE